MDFIYNHELISTQDELKISVADLRDLIQAGELIGVDEDFSVKEYQMIVDGILRKNRFPNGVILLGK